MTYQLILFDRANGLAWITLNRPERLIVSSNAFERMRHFPVHGGGKGDLGDSVERYYAPLTRRLTCR